MNKPSPVSSDTINRSTGLVLGLVAFICIALIGASGYFKYQLDLATAALAAADAALPAAARLAVQTRLELWATLLTLTAWSSLVVAAALAAGIYLALSSRNAAPLRALAQSVQNMARGDMRTSVWGTERRDTIGEVARAVDLARYHFSQLPDMSLMGEEGSVRIRFEGNARSLFEAMMGNLARDSEQIRAQAAGIAAAIDKEREAIAAVAVRVEIALGAMLRDRQGGEREVRQLLQSVSGSAQKLHSAQEIASTQLGGLVGYLQERAKGMNELTQIAGKQMAQTLQSLAHTEQNLRASAEQSQQTVQKLAASTDEIGERMFGAVSLLRAGGKVLTEATETTQSRLNEAIHLLGESEAGLRRMLAQGFQPVGSLQVPAPVAAPASALDPAETERLQAIVAGLEAAQRKLEECLAQQTQAAQAQIELLTTQSNSLLTQASTAAQTLATASDNLHEERDRLGAATGEFGERLENLGLRLERRALESFGKADTAMQGMSRLMELAAQLGPVIERLSAAVAGGAGREAADAMMTEIKGGFEVTSRSVERLREEFLAMALKQPVAPAGGFGPAESQWEKICAHINETRENLAQLMIQQTDRLEVRLAGMDKASPTAAKAAPIIEDTQSQLRQQTEILSELASALGAIDAHMQEMESTFKSLSKAS